MDKKGDFFEYLDKIKFVVNPELNKIDISKLFPEQRARTNEILSKVKMPEAYYEQQRKKAEDK